MSNCMDQDACGLYLFTALRDGEDFPAPSSLNEIDPAAILKDLEMGSAADNAFVNMALVTWMGFPDFRFLTVFVMDLLPLTVTWPFRLDLKDLKRLLKSDRWCAILNIRKRSNRPQSG